MSRKDQIEEAFGGGLHWDRLDARRAARISAPPVNGGWRDEQHWPELQTEMINRMERLEQEVRPEISELER